MKAIIIGSGIGGLTAALALVKAGIDVKLYERAPGLGEVGAGISLWSNALLALDQVGLGDRVRAACQRLTHSQLRVARGHRLAASFAAEKLEALVGSAPVVAMIHRAELVSLLASALPSDVCHYGHSCTSVVQNDRHVTAHFQTGQNDACHDEADFLIGADGIHSVVRTHVSGELPVRYSGYTCFRGVCPRPAALQPGTMAEWWGRGQRFGITTLPGDRVYWFATCNSPPAKRFDDTSEHVRRIFAGWADPVSELLASTPDDAFLHNDIIDRPPSKSWARGRVVLLGDAARATTPNLGQGGCMAIEDGIALAYFVERLHSVDDAIQRFVEFRYPRTAGVINKSWQLGRLGQWQSPWACAMRDRAMAWMIALLGPSEMVRFARYRLDGELQMAGSDK